MTSTGKKVLITGATGMVGRQVLAHLLNHAGVAAVLSVGRRETGVAHPKLREVVHQNFRDFSGIASDLVGIDVCFHCLGVYQGQVSKQDYVDITCYYQKALTDALAAASPDATFVLFSAQGADPSEKSRALFARAKGRAENLLNQTGFPKKYIFRPGYIHPTGARQPPGLAYKLIAPIGGFFLKIFPGIGMTDRDLAQAMVSTGLDGSKETTTLSSPMIRAIAGTA